jgi:electron transfer flavoprotein beta subunit
MRIIVCIKQTPDTEAQIKLIDQDRKIATQELKFILNPYDEFAIEEALRIKEKTGTGEVILVSVGLDSVKEPLLRGLAMGADRAIVIPPPAVSHMDSLLTATLLASVVQQEKGELVFCGKQGIDEDNMHVGVMLAELLDWPHVNVVTKLEITGNRARVEREIEGGQTEVYDVQLPALFGTHKSLNTPRYASLPGIMKAKKKPMDVKTYQDLGLDEATLQGLVQTTVTHYEYPPKKPAGKILQGMPTEAMVDQVVGWLRSEAKVI